MSKRILFAMAACCALALPAIAEDEPGAGDGYGHEMDPQAMQKMMEMMMPGEQHEKMNFWVGTWKTMTKSAMTGEETEGTYSFEWTLGNRCMVGHFSGTMMGQPFEGMSLDGYNNQTGEYYSIWMDTFGTGYTSFTGHAEGEDSVVFTGTGKDPMSGADVNYRAVSTITGDASFSYTMYMDQGGEEVMIMEMTGTRM